MLKFFMHILDSRLQASLQKDFFYLFLLAYLRASLPHLKINNELDFDPRNRADVLFRFYKYIYLF